MLNELDWGVLGRQQEYDAKVTLNEKINEIIKK